MWEHMASDQGIGQDSKPPSEWVVASLFVAQDPTPLAVPVSTRVAFSVIIGGIAVKHTNT